MDNAISWAGKQIDGYRLTKLLSASRRSCLYLAHDAIQPDRVVVLKRLKCQLDEHGQQLFLKEASYLPKMRHPFILSVLQVGVEEGYPFVVAEYAPGGSLRDKLENLHGQILPTREIEQILSQIAEGLKGGWPVSHLDLKPETILFDAQGNVQIAYFYLIYFYCQMKSFHSASASASGIYSQALSLPYVEPALLTEQLPGESADQYSLGSIAYEMFTGQKPFSKLLEPLASLRSGAQIDPQTILQIIVSYLSEAPLAPRHLNLALPHFQEQAILKAMAKDPVQRYPEISAFLAALFPITHQQ